MLACTIHGAEEFGVGVEINPAYLDKMGDVAWCGPGCQSADDVHLGQGWLSPLWLGGNRRERQHE